MPKIELELLPELLSIKWKTAGIIVQIVYFYSGIKAVSKSIFFKALRFHAHQTSTVGLCLAGLKHQI